MSDYMSYREVCKSYEGFPEMDIKAIEDAVNRHFKPYIFFRDTIEGRQIYASCCGREMLWPGMQRLENAAQQSISWGAHNYEAVCPFCGRAVKLKQIGRCGQMKKLQEWHPFFVYAERDGVLYAQGFWCRKIYWPADENSLTAAPEFRALYSYRYEQGKAEYKERYYDKWIMHDFVPGKQAQGTGTFGKFYGRGKGVAFRTINSEAIDRSFLRYCQYEKWSSRSLIHGTHTDLPQYLAWASVYTRQIEMLVKFGLGSLVTCLICGYERKRILNWQEPDLLKAFDLSKQEMKFVLSRGNPYFLEHYKRIRASGDKTTIQEAAEISDSVDDMRKFITYAKRTKTSVRKLKNYLEKFTGPRCYGAYFDLNSAFKLWADYIDMMKYLERDIKVHKIAFPCELELAHNEAAGEQAARLELEALEKEKEELVKFAASLDERRKKYNFEFGEHFIRIAESKTEIVREGEILQHCVGGYADRHARGQTTILFLRRSRTPEAALYTIEMDGNQMRQIHGFKNDRSGPDPKVVMSEMLDAWLDWLKRGSPRDKAGNPKIRRKKKETNAA